MRVAVGVAIGVAGGRLVHARRVLYLLIKLVLLLLEKPVTLLLDVDL